MKKLLSIIVLSLLFSGNVYAKSVSGLIQDVTIDDVKSKLIDTHLDQGYDIEDETNNKITFVKEVKSFKIKILMSLLSDDVKTYERVMFNFSKKNDDVKIYYSLENFSGDEVLKLKSKSGLKLLQQWLYSWIKNF